MKRVSSSILLVAVLCLMGTKALAYDIAVENADGVTIYYNYFHDRPELEVTYMKINHATKSYSGAVVIPEEVTLMNKTWKVTSIGERAFDRCSDLTSVTIPSCVTSIGTAAFQDCSGLTSVTIPSNATSIGQWAFLRCTGLTSVTIPSSVTSIEGGAFLRCSGLTAVTIPSSVTSIGWRAFQGCSGLTSVTIPNSVKRIEEGVFYGCDILEVISKIESPFHIDTSVFSNNTFNNATLYVPAGSIDKYKAAEGWKRFVSIEEGDPTPDGITWSATPTTVVLTQGQVTVNGASDGTSISIYNANGVLLGAAISWNGSATIDTSLQAGNVAIVKVGEKSVKVIAK